MKDFKEILWTFLWLLLGALVGMMAVLNGYGEEFEKAVEKGEYISTDHRTYTCQRLPDANSLFNNRGLELGWPPVKAP